MRVQMRPWRLGVWRAVLIALAITASLAAGGSIFIYASPFSPLLVLGGIIAVALGITLLQNPVWALYATIFLMFLPDGLIPSDFRSVLVDLILLLALLSWLLRAVFLRQRLIWASTTLLMLSFLVWGITTLCWAPSLVSGRQELVEYTIGLILLVLITNEIESLQIVDGLMITLALNGLVLASAGTATILSQGYELGTRLRVLEMNENSFGISLIVAMQGVLWCTLRPAKRWGKLRRSVGVLFMVLTFVLVGLSGSRGSTVSLITTLLAFRLWKPTRLWGRLSLLILAAAVIGTPFFFSSIASRFLMSEGGVLGGRLALWQAGWLLIRDHPWRGVGIGNASHAVIPYLRTLTYLWGQTQRSIHSPVLQVWADTGIPGVLLYIGVLASAVWTFLRHYNLLKRIHVYALSTYFAIVSSVFAGYMLSWIKGGGMQHHLTYFLMLALLLIPSRLNPEGLKRNGESNVHGVGRAICER